LEVGFCSVLGLFSVLGLSGHKCAISNSFISIFLCVKSLFLYYTKTQIECAFCKTICNLVLIEFILLLWLIILMIALLFGTSWLNFCISCVCIIAAFKIKFVFILRDLLLCFRLCFRVVLAYLDFLLLIEINYFEALILSLLNIDE
jgi:hypothetical protein